jgi:hypothetical protein
MKEDYISSHLTTTGNPDAPPSISKEDNRGFLYILSLRRSITQCIYWGWTGTGGIYIYIYIFFTNNSTIEDILIRPRNTESFTLKISISFHRNAWSMFLSQYSRARGKATCTLLKLKISFKSDKRWESYI